MTLWVDAQLSPALAIWIAETFAVEAHALRDLGFRDAKDSEIFSAARNAGAVVITKDRDFILLLDRHGPPPQVLWVTCGNTSNARLKGVFQRALPMALRLLTQGERVVEITDAI